MSITEVCTPATDTQGLGFKAARREVVNGMEQEEKTKPKVSLSLLGNKNIGNRNSNTRCARLYLCVTQ